MDVILGVWISRYYFGSVVYTCPECHSIFKPRFKEALFARHTIYTRKLTCTACGHHGAGKTTTLKCICGIHGFEQGEIIVDGVTMAGDANHNNSFEQEEQKKQRKSGKKSWEI